MAEKSLLSSDNEIVHHSGICRYMKIYYILLMFDGVI